MKKIPYTLFLLLCFVAALATGCTKDSDNDNQDDIVAQARADHKLASEYDEQWKMRLAEIYYKKAYDALSDNPEKDWKCYGHSGYAYACMLYNRGEIEQTMTVLSDIISKAENNKKFPPVSGAGTIQMMARCQEQLGMYQEAKPPCMALNGLASALAMVPSKEAFTSISRLWPSASAARNASLFSKSTL